jgi:outer membrane protein assembly factor BamD
MGNNYESCVITSREALKNYPYSKLTEEFQILILRARFDLADNSIEERKPLRFRDVIDEYFNYQNMFPEGKYKEESESYYKKALELLGEDAPKTIIKTDVKN